MQGTASIPVDGIVKQTSDKIVADAKPRSDIKRPARIYEWIVDNTFRDAKVRGCGIGDIAAMLKTGNLGGKCADLNALYVGLARAAGLPARDHLRHPRRAIEVRLQEPGRKFGGHHQSAALPLRRSTSPASAGCRSMPPTCAKVVLEEPPKNLPIDDPKVAAAREALFGAWETNWLAYNFAHDVALPGSTGREGRVPDVPAGRVAACGSIVSMRDFKYTITAKELTAA